MLGLRSVVLHSDLDAALTNGHNHNYEPVLQHVNQKSYSPSLSGEYPKLWIPVNGVPWGFKGVPGD